jgi:hypothetical protein
MKNLLSENMLRFGTKNLSEAAQRELVLKSVMQTINEHGLHNAVRSRLTEADAPNDKKYAFKDDYIFSNAYDLGIKRGTDADGDQTGPLVYQSNTSVSEASAILGELFQVLGKSKASDSTAIINVLKKINKNNYYAILWKVRYGTSFKNGNSFKSNFNSLYDYLSNFIDKPAGAANNAKDSTVGSPLPSIYNLFQDGTIFNWIKGSMLPKYNIDETPEGPTL